MRKHLGSTTAQGQLEFVELEVIARDAKDTVHEQDGGNDDVGARSQKGTDILAKKKHSRYTCSRGLRSYAR